MYNLEERASEMVQAHELKNGYQNDKSLNENVTPSSMSQSVSVTNVSAMSVNPSVSECGGTRDAVTWRMSYHKECGDVSLKPMTADMKDQVMHDENQSSADKTMDQVIHDESQMSADNMRDQVISDEGVVAAEKHQQLQPFSVPELPHVA
jgi:hypothetical protein